MRKFIVLFITGLALVLAAPAMGDVTQVKSRVTLFGENVTGWAFHGSVTNGKLSPKGRRVVMFRDNHVYLGSCLVGTFRGHGASYWRISGRIPFPGPRHHLSVYVQDRFLTNGWIDELPTFTGGGN
jgi:hypothetical protein